jgi:hypothetical protein
LASTDSRLSPGLPTMKPADHDHLVAMQMVDRLKRRIPRFPPVLALAVLGFGSEEPQVLLKDVLDAEEDVAEAGLPHQPGERLAMAEVVA